jgi:hypothetical protein
MKTKFYLFRIVAGSLAFLFSLGIYTVWQSFQTTAAPTPPPAMAETDLKKLSETYPMLLLPSEITVATAITENVEDEAESPFDAEGYYYIAGELPKGFKDFESFNVRNKNYESEDESEYGKLIAPQGSVDTGKEFNFRKISIGNDQIQFETESVKGIIYSFSGYFTKTRNFVYLEPEEKLEVLEGRLIKKRGGKKIAEAQMKFGWFAELECGC